MWSNVILLITVPCSEERFLDKATANANSDKLVQKFINEMNS